MTKFPFLLMDFETFSTVDIGKCGSYRYMDDPSFEPLLLSYAMNDDPVKLVDFTRGETWPEDFFDALFDPDVTKIAWSGAVERNAIYTDLHEYTPPEQWLDVMHVAAQCGLPMSLDAAGKALGLSEDQAKMKEGKTLIRYFCCPCKPTKINGGRERNFPEHAPKKWETFRDYCTRDTEAERTIFHMLEQWLPNKDERRFWALDQRINEKGVRIDRQLALNAVAMDERYKEELTERAVAITGLSNPKSVSQVKNWLADQEGKTFPSLNKKVIADVVSQLQTDDAREFMALRSELSKSSTAKYQAMLRSMCRDEHSKGCFQFYGANRTGRFAGRLVQFQNMSKNYSPTLASMRELVRGGHYTALNTLYDSVSSVLSELVRTAIIPEEGQRIVVADFSAIEARVTAWFAGEEWRLQTFRDGGDIYCMSASQMFHVPVVKHGINGELRQKGKVAELACIAEGELVLTDQGLVPIQDVTNAMRVWDGVEWVKHEGVVLQGEREVISYGGLIATEDHPVWVEGEPEPVQFGIAAARGARLMQAGDCGTPLRAGQDHQPGEAVEPAVESLLRADRVPIVREDHLAGPEQPDERQLQGLPSLLTAGAHVSAMAGQESDGAEAALHEPGGQRLCELRGPRRDVRLSERKGCVPVDHGEPWHPCECTGAGLGPCGQREGLCTGKPALGDAEPEQREPQEHKDYRMACGGLAVLPDNRDEKARRGHDAGADSGRGLGVGAEKMPELAEHRKVVRVYDIKNAGPRHRYTVSGVLVHNCGYGGGVNALKAFGADKMGLSDEEMQEIVDNWRESSPKIVELWRALEKAAIRCIVRRAPTVSTLGNVRFDFESGILWMTLPSGRRLAYYGAKYEPTKFHPDRKSLTYMGVNQMTKRWERVETWGGKITENLVQATARDVLREAMFSLTEKGWDIRAHVHDECICTEPIGGKTVEQMCRAMCPDIPWAEGLPLNADGYDGPYYFKD